MKLYNFEYFLDHIIGMKETALEKSLDELNENVDSFLIDKKKGKRRIYYINNPDLKIKEVQKNLLKNFLYKIPISPVANGFSKGGSYNKSLSAHIGAKYFMHIDIKNFFGSITEEQVKNSLKEYIGEDEESQKILEDIIRICMYEEDNKNVLPTGYMTSPAISNIIFRRIDQCILKYCQSIKIGGKQDIICYTRYADDLLFSSPKLDFGKQIFFYNKINYILRTRGFNSNKKKTIISEDKIVLNGFVIGEDLHLSNSKMHNINKLIFYFDKRQKIQSKFVIDQERVKDNEIVKHVNGELKLKNKEFKNKEEIIQYLCGYRSFFISIIKANSKKNDNIQSLTRKVRKIESIIDALNIQ